MPNTTFKSKSEAQTFRHGADFAEKIKKSLTLILLKGPVGAGKTAWVKGFVWGYLKKKNEVTSASYTLVNRYSRGSREIIHFDLYRLTSQDDLESVGFWDYLSGKRVVIVEWGESIVDIPSEIDTYSITFDVIGEVERCLSTSSSS